jgi:hypothetical protein
MVHGLDRATPALPAPPQAPLAGPLPGSYPRTLGRDLQHSQGRGGHPQADRAGLPPTLEVLPTDAVDAAKAQTLFGDYVAKVWWPTWRAQHPDSAYQTGKPIENRILPFFGNLCW